MQLEDKVERLGIIVNELLEVLYYADVDPESSNTLCRWDRKDIDSLRESVKEIIRS